MTLAPPAPDLAVVRVSDLEAALEKLEITGVTATELLEAVKKEEKNPPPSTSSPERTRALLELARHPPKDEHGSIPPYKSSFSMVSVTASGHTSDKARRQRLRDLARKDFPEGKIPDPYTATWLNVYGDASTKDLPFIQATIRVSPYDWPDGTAEPVQTFHDAWVLWDTGAHATQILSSQLRDDIKKDESGVVQQSGFAVAKVRFQGIQHEIEANIVFRENMPNDTTFIILGQQTLLNSIQYQIQPTLINPALLANNPNAYGQIDLISYRDPVTPGAPLVNL